MLLVVLDWEKSHKYYKWGEKRTCLHIRALYSEGLSLRATQQGNRSYKAIQNCVKIISWDWNLFDRALSLNCQIGFAVPSSEQHRIKAISLKAKQNQSQLLNLQCCIITIHNGPINGEGSSSQAKRSLFLMAPMLIAAIILIRLKIKEELLQDKRHMGGRGVMIWVDWLVYTTLYLVVDISTR